MSEELIADHSQGESGHSAERWSPVSLHSGLGGDVLEDEVDNSTGGEGHDTGCEQRIILEQKVAGAGGNRAEETDEEEAFEGFTRAVLSFGHFTEGVESLGEVLCGDEDGEEDSCFAAVAEEGSKRDGFGNEVDQHRHQLSFAAALLSNLSIENTKRQTAEAEDRTERGWAEFSNGLGEECEGNGCEQYAPAKGNDSVKDLTPGVGDFFSAGKDESQESADEGSEAGHP